MIERLVALALLLPQDAPPAPVQGPPVPAPAPAPAASGDTAAAPESPAAENPSNPMPLQPGEVAHIGGFATLTYADLDRYLGTVYARLPEGDDTLQQLLGETLIAQDAAARGITATDADVDGAMAALDSQARAASGAEGKGLLDSVQAGVDSAQVRNAVRLLVLHERLVRADDNLSPDAPIEPRRMQDWLTQRIAAAKLQPAPLDDPQAATFEGGSISKAAVGARLRSVLTQDVVSGVLTEMIGVLLVRQRAGQLGVDLTTAAATREVIERDAALRAQPGAGDVTYAEFVEQVQKRSLKELLTSDKFSTEVLIRLLTEHDYDEDKARAFWEQNKEAFVKASNGKLTADSDWNAARLLVWRDLRQRTYRYLFEQSRIARRF